MSHSLFENVYLLTNIVMQCFKHYIIYYSQTSSNYTTFLSIDSIIKTLVYEISLINCNVNNLSRNLTNINVNYKNLIPSLKYNAIKKVISNSALSKYAAWRVAFIVQFVKYY